MKKRIVSFLMALVMAVSLLPVSALAAEDTYSVAPDTTVQKVQQEAEQAVSEGSTQQSYPIFSKLVFAGDLAFDEEITYYGQPEGTLFQLGENGERTGQVGLADDCFHYAVYVSSMVNTVKPAGKKAMDYLKNSFVYAPDKAKVSVSAVTNGETTEVVTSAPTRMAACMKLFSTSIKLGDHETEMLIKFADKTTNKVVRTYSIMFIKQAMDVDTLTVLLKKLETEKLVWPDDNDYVAGLVQGYNNLSADDKAEISADLKAKLDRAKEIVSDNRVPEKLEIKTPPAKLNYSPDQSFDPTGMVVVAIYADGTTRTLDKAKYYTVTPSGVLGDATEVTISYNGKSVTQKIQIVGLTLEGKGTEENPYLLSNAGDLENLRQYVAAGQATEGKYFRMTTNITLPDGWQPIGCTKDGTNNIQKGANLNAFSGSIDGAGYTLTVPKGGLPLLGYIKGAEVKNLNIYGEQIDGYGLVNNFEGVGLSGSAIVIDNVTLKSGTKTLKAGLLGANITTNGFAGCSAGFVATVRNCTAEKGVVIGYTGTESGIGSFVGRLQGTVENCVSYATVKGDSMVGGIISRRDNAVGICEVIGCTFDGDVIATGSNVGGIMGSMYVGGGAPNAARVKTQGCIVSGTVIGKENVGGIIGSDIVTYQNWGNAAISGNTFSGKISGEKNVGGIIGFFRSLDCRDDIAGNVYTVDCGADKWYGAVEYVDTNYENPTPVEGTTYVNSENGLTGVSGMTKNGMNRTDDPLGKDASNLGIAVTDATNPVCYKLDIFGDYETTYTVGDSLDFSDAVITAHWTMGKADTIVDAKDITVSGYDSNKHGQQTVTLQYGAAKVEIVVTVLYKEPEKIAVTITLLGDTKHGDNGEVHGLSKGGLTAWVSGHEVEATTNMTVWDALQKLPNVKWENPTGNYIKGVTYGGVTLGELDNGKNSGWMYTLNDEYPLLGVSEQYLKKGDVIVFHYTDDYTHDFAFDADKKTAKEIVAMIAAIGTVDLGKGSAITAARTAYDALTDSEKALVTNYAVLTAAEKTYAGLVAGLSKKLDSIYKTTGDYLSKLGTPGVGSIGGEWMVLGLARSGRAVPSGYYDNVVKHVRENIRSDGRLDRTKTTENARIILALTAMGKDPTNVGGYNLLDGFYNMRDCLKKQGVNAPIFALLALDSHNYTPTHNDVTRDGLVELILSDQVKADGGWALEGADAKVSDVDMTAMAIQSLAPYYDTDSTVREAVDKALALLSSKQQAGGGFTSWGSANSESCAQVIVALTALGIDPASDSRFIKNGATMLDALCSYYVEGGGFKHTSDGTLNGMATEQGYYALAAYYRLVNKQTSLYDMSDVCIGHTFGDWTVTKVATCTEDGSRTRICSVCKAEETETIKALGHSMTAVAAKAATCTDPGNSAHWDCARCGKSFSDAAAKTEIVKGSWVIAALGHDEATRAAVAPTCYASGRTAETYCKRCGLVITAGTVIQATGKHTYENGVCSTCGVKNPLADVKGDTVKVDSKNDKTAAGGGLVIKADNTITDGVLEDIKAAVSSGAITVTVADTLQPTNEQKAADGGKSALTEAAKNVTGDAKQELTKLAEKLDALRGDKSRKNARLEKVVDVSVALVKTEGNEIKTVAQLIELPHSVTVTIPITDELYAALQGKRVCVVRSHTDSNGSVTTAELPATLGGTKGNYVLTFQTDKASTFAIVSYETVSSGYYYGGSGTADSGKKDSAKTADDSQMVVWLGSAVLAAAGVVILSRKKRAVK